MGAFRRSGDRCGAGPDVRVQQHLLSPDKSGQYHCLPLSLGVYGSGGWFNDKQKYYQDYTGLEEENARLRQQIASMEAEIRQARDDSAENERLKELLGLQEERPDLTEDIVLATITEHAVTNWAATLTISRGTNDGLEVGDCVIDETGALVGTISAVGTNWATILTLVDTDTSLGAQVFPTGDLGGGQGDFSLMGENRLRLDYLPADCDLLGGDLVVTSGLGAFSPRGW